MTIEKNTYEISCEQRAGDHGSARAMAKRLLDRGTEVYGQAEQAVSDAYDKTSRAVTKTYDQAKSFGTANPGKSILIASGIALGLGLLLAAASRRPRTEE